MRQDSGIGVLDKAVGVLHTVAESPCGLAELCERTGLPRATAHRLAAGLEVHRLLARDGDGRWRLGPASTELAGQVNDPLLAASAAVLPRLREITGESVQLYRREGTVAGLRRGAGTACGASRYGAGRDPPADDGRIGSQGAAGLQRCRHAAGRAARRRSSPTAHWPRCASAAGRRAPPNVNRGWRASRRRCATAAAWSIAAVSVSGPIDRMGRRPGARWAADLLAAADALTRRL